VHGWSGPNAVHTEVFRAAAIFANAKNVADREDERHKIGPYD
jgi:hypothetical protein